MARRAVLSSPEDSDHEEDTQNDDSRTRRRQGRVDSPTELSPSPATSFSSDKENRVINPTRNANGKARAMPPPSKVPTTNSAEAEATRASKRRRLSERDAPDAPDASFAAAADQPANTSLYDPDQNINERRAIRKEYRDLSRVLTGRRRTHISR